MNIILSRLLPSERLKRYMPIRIPDYVIFEKGQPTAVYFMTKTEKGHSTFIKKVKSNKYGRMTLEKVRNYFQHKFRENAERKKKKKRKQTLNHQNFQKNNYISKPNDNINSTDNNNAVKKSRTSKNPFPINYDLQMLKFKNGKKFKI